MTPFFRIVYPVCMAAGIVAVAVGVYLLLTQQYSMGATPHLAGYAGFTSINGPGAIFTGMVLVACALLSRHLGKKRQERLDKMEE